MNRQGHVFGLDRIRHVQTQFEPGFQIRLTRHTRHPKRDGSPVLRLFILATEQHRKAC